MAGNENEKELDIVDRAMADDDFDYGDKEVATVGQNDDQNVDHEIENDAEPARGSVPAIQGRDAQQQPSNVPAPTGARTSDNPNGYQRVGSQFADGKGNIVDKDGKIVATRGQSARLWQEKSRAEAKANGLERQIATMKRQMDQANNLIKDAQEIAGLPAKLGISREDYNEGITLMSKWRSNPVEVAKTIVARTMALGYKATQILGNNAGDAVEMTALRRMIDEATAPVRQQTEQQRREAERNALAQRETEQFLARYPDAEIHSDAIARVMNERGVPAVDAYYAVKQSAQKYGFDWSQPLEPQVEAFRAAQAGQRSTPPPQGLPMNHGVGGRSQQTQPATRRDPGIDDSYSDIIRTVIAEQAQ